MQPVSMMRMNPVRFGVVGSPLTEGLKNKLSQALSAQGMDHSKVRYHANMDNVHVLPVNGTDPKVIANAVEQVLGAEYVRTNPSDPDLVAAFKKPYSMVSVLIYPHDNFFFIA